MQLVPGVQDEYRMRHNPIWPELEDILRSHGVHNYSIFLDRASDRLFAYVELESEELWEQIASTDVCRRWWSYMKQLMNTNPDDSPETLILEEVFHLE
jgi:L-rhamnose mutarotase